MRGEELTFRLIFIEVFLPVYLITQLGFNIFQGQLPHGILQRVTYHIVTQCGKQQMLGGHEFVTAGVGNNHCRGDDILKIC